MSYTANDNQKIIESYWSGQARCPKDDSLMELKEIRNTPAKVYNLVGMCPRCRETVNAGTKDDPLHSQFRAWSSDEKDVMADDFFKNNYSSCPVCNASVHVNPIKSPFATQLLFFCPRCFNQGQYNPPAK